MYLRFFIIIALLLRFTSVNAEISTIIIDDLLKKNQFSYGIQIDYVNIESNNVTAIERMINIGDRTIFLPVIGSDNVDAFTINPSISYGLNENTLASLNLSYISNQRRTIIPHSEYNNNYLNDINLGLSRNLCADLNYLANNEKNLCENFGLRGSFSISIMQAKNLNGKTNFDLGKNYNMGLSAYTKVDPLVLAFDINYGLTLERTLENVEYDPPNSLSISPSVMFSVNERISLVSGFSWQRTGTSKINGISKTNEISRTSTGLNMGLNWRLTKALIFSTNVGTNISGNDQANIGMSFTYTP